MLYVFLPILAAVFIVSFILARKAKDRIVSELSPFSFAEDVLVVNTGAGFAVQRSQIDCVRLQYKPEALKNRFYDMKISIVKTDGSAKNFGYRGSGSGATPEQMEAELSAHAIKYTVCA